MPRYDKCILYVNKPCTDCGECDKCDLDANKICDNCGECLKEDKYDVKSVEVDEIVDEEDDIESLEFEPENQGNPQEDDDLEGDIPMEFIDDIDGLRDILEDENKSKQYTYEEFPGLIRIKKQK